MQVVDKKERKKSKTNADIQKRKQEKKKTYFHPHDAETEEKLNAVINTRIGYFFIYLVKCMYCKIFLVLSFHF